MDDAIDLMFAAIHVARCQAGRERQCVAYRQERWQARVLEQDAVKRTGMLYRRCEGIS
ncbi:MAG: hypothetical protein U0610_20880 [bacterium]